jgi:hypothetical protein
LRGCDRSARGPGIRDSSIFVLAGDHHEGLFLDGERGSLPGRPAATSGPRSAALFRHDDPPS